VAEVSPTVLMVDLFTPTSPRWYSGTLKEGSVKLDALENVRGMDKWQAPLDGERVEEKSLLFILDFRNSTLKPGDHYLMLEFSSGSCNPSAAPFRVSADLDKTGALTWSDTGTTLQVTTPGGDIDYAEGALVRLTGLPGETVGKVTATDENGKSLELIAGGDAVFLPLPGLAQGGTAEVIWSFPAMETSTAVTTELFPLPVFQTSRGAAPSVVKELTLTGSGGDAAAAGRAMVVELTGGERVLDSAATEGAVLTFTVTPDKALVEGESVTVTQILKKTKSDPGDDSYTLKANGWRYDPGTGKLTLPKLSAGTYRICFQLQKNGSPKAECPFNIIVR